MAEAGGVGGDDDGEESGEQSAPRRDCVLNRALYHLAGLRGPILWTLSSRMWLAGILPEPPPRGRNTETSPGSHGGGGSGGGSTGASSTATGRVDAGREAAVSEAGQPNWSCGADAGAATGSAVAPAGWTAPAEARWHVAVPTTPRPARPVAQFDANGKISHLESSVLGGSSTLRSEGAICSTGSCRRRSACVQEGESARKVKVSRAPRFWHPAALVPLSGVQF